MQDFHVYDVIAQGSVTKVYRGRRKRTLEYVAVRATPLARASALAPSLALWGSLPRHPNVLGLHAVHRSERNLYTVCDLAAGGSLARALVSDGGLPEASIRLFAADALCALWHLHGAGAAANCLCSSRFVMDENGALLLGNLERVQRLARGSAGEAAAVPLECLPPERVPHVACAGACPLGHQQLCAVVSPPDALSGDFWALGLLLYQLATARGSPFCGWEARITRPPAAVRVDVEGAYAWIHDLTLPLGFPVSGAAASSAFRCPPSPAFKHLVTGLLTRDPSRRLGWAQVLTHPWWYAATDDDASSGAPPGLIDVCASACLDPEGYLLFPGRDARGRWVRARAAPSTAGGDDPWPWSTLSFGLPIATHVSQLPDRKQAASPSDSESNSSAEESEEEAAAEEASAAASPSAGADPSGVASYRNNSASTVIEQPLPQSPPLLQPVTAAACDNSGEEPPPPLPPLSEDACLPSADEISLALESEGKDDDTTEHPDAEDSDDEESLEGKAPSPNGTMRDELGSPLVGAATPAEGAGKPQVPESLATNALEAEVSDVADYGSESVLVTRADAAPAPLPTDEDALLLAPPGEVSIQDDSLEGPAVLAAGGEQREVSDAGSEAPSQLRSRSSSVAAGEAHSGAPDSAALDAALAAPLPVFLQKLSVAACHEASTLASAASAFLHDATPALFSAPLGAGAGTFLFGYEGCPVPLPSIPPVEAPDGSPLPDVASVLPFPWEPPSRVRAWAASFDDPSSSASLHAHFRAMYHGIIGAGSSSSGAASGDKSLAALAYIAAVAVPPVAGSAGGAAATPRGDPAACELLLNSSLARLLQVMATRSRSLAVQVRASYVLCLLARFAASIAHTVVFKDGLAAALAGAAGWAPGVGGSGAKAGDASGAASPVTRRLALFALLELLFYAAVQGEAEEDGADGEREAWRPPAWAWGNLAAVLGVAAGATPADPQTLLVIATFLCNLCLCAPAAARAAARALWATNGGEGTEAAAPGAEPLAAATLLLRAAAGVAAQATARFHSDAAGASSRLVDTAAPWAARECARAAALFVQLAGPDALAGLTTACDPLVGRFTVAAAEAGAAVAAAGLWHWVPAGCGPAPYPPAPETDPHSQAALAATPLATWLLEAAAGLAAAVASAGSFSSTPDAAAAAFALAEVLLPLARLADTAGSAEAAAHATPEALHGHILAPAAAMLLTATGVVAGAVLASPLPPPGLPDLARAVCRRGLSALASLLPPLCLSNETRTTALLAAVAWIAAVGTCAPPQDGSVDRLGWLLAPSGGDAHTELSATQRRLAASLRAMQAALAASDSESDVTDEAEVGLGDEDAADEDGSDEGALDLLPLLASLLRACPATSHADSLAAVALAVDVAAAAGLPPATTRTSSAAWAAAALQLPSSLCLAPAARLAAVTGVLLYSRAAVSQLFMSPAGSSFVSGAPLQALSCLLLDDADGEELTAAHAAAGLAATLGLGSSVPMCAAAWHAAAAGAQVAVGLVGGSASSAAAAGAALLRCHGLLAHACVVAGSLRPEDVPLQAPLLPGLVLAAQAVAGPSASETAASAAVTWLGQALPAALDDAALHAFADEVLAWSPTTLTLATCGVSSSADTEALLAAFPTPLAALIALVDTAEGGEPSRRVSKAAARLLAALCRHPDVAAATAQDSDLL